MDHTMGENQAALSAKIVDSQPSGGVGGTIALIVLMFALFMGALFPSSFWTPGEKYSPAQPRYAVSIRGGNAPAIELRQKIDLAGGDEALMNMAKVR